MYFLRISRALLGRTGKVRTNEWKSASLERSQNILYPLGLGWFLNTIRERFCGGSFDGQYIKLNVPDHFAKKMLLRKEFTQKSITWDITHHIELASDDTKKTKLNGLKTSIPHFSLS